MGAADEELAGDQQREKAARSHRGVARVSARGVPKSLGNKGVASWGVRDSAKSNARAQFNAEEHAKHCVRRWEEGWEEINASKVHLTGLCFHARLMPRTTPILYCKRAALHHVRTAHPILVTIGPPSSSKGLGDEATRALASAQEGVAPRGYNVYTW